MTLKPALLLGLVVLGFGCPARAATLVGARDGGYRAADGAFLYVDVAGDWIGVDSLECHHPAVRAGRIVTTDCWANGHLMQGLDATWSVEGDAVVIGGKQYVRMPRVAQPAGPSRVEPSGRPWSHNGSVVQLDQETGVIAYHVPKAALHGVVEDGTVLFRGRLRLGGTISGIAYAFKAGCRPAAYPVRGTYTNNGDSLTLHGAGPVRRGCDVVGYSDGSPHALLRFRYLLDD